MGKIKRDNDLLANLKSNLPELEKLLEEVKGEWQYEDMIYRLYHNSFKCYYAQAITTKMVGALTKLVDTIDTPPNENGGLLNKDFMTIIQDGTGKTFDLAHNKEWLSHTRPIIEAFLHAKYFLEMAVKYGKELKEAPNMLPSGWASFLYLYNMR